jgi:hypothetical protein
VHVGFGTAHKGYQAKIEFLAMLKSFPVRQGIKYSLH